MAATPAAVYEFRRKDFDDVRRACPEIQAALEKADRERRKELDAL